MKDGKFDSTKIREASDIIGSGLKLANAINISQALIYRWMTGTAQPSPIACLRIQKATGGKVKARDILPEFDWDNILPAE